MNIIRAIWTGAIVWALIFFEVSILMFGFKLQPSVLYYVIHYILIAVFAFIFAYIYFNAKKVKANILQGLLLGLTWMVVGIILDTLITVLLFTKTFAFFLDPMLWLGYLIVIAIATIKGVLMQRK